ncbi:RNA polymerase sigma factor [Sediminicola luteus]|uniref:RNA polymerase subunit sigma-70 n=1 Tax=Sediminicola luteus TaxID=319238 RepID=A0A2A4G530_9FLAO|nr:sigma-70 family RNA polymerase sigma factor [Sediminicola luteus]PCE64069.1 hypothetical protein B7P33_12580 [Sediminicola luteus]
MQEQIESQLKRLLNDHKQSLYRICKVYAVNPMEPKDLFQEVIIEIWRALPRYKEDAKLHTWAYTIALRVCSRKKAQYDKKDNLRLNALTVIPVSLPQEDEVQERTKALYQCIGHLAEKERQLIILHLEGLAYRDMASVSGITENHVAVKMKRIRKKLLACLTPKSK